jgi:hypothetical protein
MGTLMACVLAHTALPGASCQTVSVERLTARASAAAPGPGARVAVPGGSGGSGRQGEPVLVMMSPRFPARMIAAVPPGPNDAEIRAAPLSGSGGDSVQWPPSSADQAASRLAAGSVPAGFQNSATGAELGFYAARSYSLMRPPRTGRRWIRSLERSATE